MTVRAPDPKIPRALQVHWHQVAVSTCLRHAALLRLVPWGTAELRALSLVSSELYATAVKACDRECARACVNELASGRRDPEIEQRLNASLWRVLKPFERADTERSAEMESTSTSGENGHVGSEGNTVPTRKDRQ